MMDSRRNLVLHIRFMIACFESNGLCQSQLEPDPANQFHDSTQIHF